MSDSSSEEIETNKEEKKKEEVSIELPETTKKIEKKKKNKKKKEKERENEKEEGDDHPGSKVGKVLCAIRDHKTMEQNQLKMLLYTFATLVYLGINLAEFGLNFRDQDFIESNYYLPFHLLEFWAVFAFTLIEAFVLVSTGTLDINGPWTHILQIGLAWFDILFTLIIAIIFSMDPQEYEIPAHFMEYSAQVFITLINFIFLINYLRNKTYQGTVFWRFRYFEILLAVFTFFLSIFQFFIYTEVIPTAPGGERSTHFFEFITESINALFVLWFSAVTYRQMNRQLEIHYEMLHKIV